jgi:hypothetical protein
MLRRKPANARKGNLLMPVRTPAVASKEPSNARKYNLHKIARQPADVNKQT